MKTGITVELQRGIVTKAMKGSYDLIAGASTAAMRAAADDAKSSARASIARAGFSKRWQNTLRVDVYPKKGTSASAAVHVWHKIPYADVFESGETVRGSPTLWVPLSHTPKKKAGKKLTPEVFISQVGDLFQRKARNGKVMLMAQMMVSRAQARRGAPYKVTMSALTRGGRGTKTGRSVPVAVPVFVGVRSVDIRRKFGIAEAMDNAAGALPALYNKHLKVGG